MQLERIVASAPQPKAFQQANAAASQTDVALKVVSTFDGTAVGANDVVQVVMPYPGSIVGVTVSASAARSGGTLTVAAAKNGSTVGLTAVLNATDTQWARSTQGREADRFDAGDRIGCLITTDGSWAPTTADIVAEVWVIPEYRGA